MPRYGSDVEQDGYCLMSFFSESFLLTSKHYADLAEEKATYSYGNT